MYFTRVADRQSIRPLGNTEARALADMDAAFMQLSVQTKEYEVVENGLTLVEMKCQSYRRHPPSPA